MVRDTMKSWTIGHTPPSRSETGTGTSVWMTEDTTGDMTTTSAESGIGWIRGAMSVAITQTGATGVRGMTGEAEKADTKGLLRASTGGL